MFFLTIVDFMNTINSTKANFNSLTIIINRPSIKAFPKLDTKVVNNWITKIISKTGDLFASKGNADSRINSLFSVL